LSCSYPASPAYPSCSTAYSAYPAAFSILTPANPAFRAAYPAHPKTFLACVAAYPDRPAACSIVFVL